MRPKTLSINLEDEIANNDYKAFKLYIHELTGIRLDENQFYLISNRLGEHKRRLRIDKWSDYLSYLRSHHELVSQDVINLITTNKTEFFREKIQFSLFKDILIEEKREDILLWSAACSRGHEVYSFDMCLNELRESTSIKRWNILGTDINSNVLSIAEKAIYPKNDFDNVDVSILRKYFKQGVGVNAGLYKYSAKNIDHIKFRYHHLLKSDHLNLSFDFIILRNVLIYFDLYDRSAIVKKLILSLKEGGYLFLGLSESIDRIHELEYLGNSIYRKKNSREESRIKQKRKRILVIDDSTLISKLVEKILNEDGSYEFVGHALNATEARKMILELRPDLITLDIHMPGENGDELFTKFIKERQIPTIILSSLEKEEGNIVLNMLEEGVSDYIHKPQKENLHNFKIELLSKVENALKSKRQKILIMNQEPTKFNVRDIQQSLIAIGASTGGTVALSQLLPTFPTIFPPTIIIQHIPKAFSLAFAERLNSLCSFKVKEAQDGESLQHSTVYIAPGDKQLKIIQEKGVSKIEINNDPPVNRHSPSVDYLFESLKNLKFKKLVAVMLTGMGRDGAQEMLELKKLGHKTIGQSEESCVVYGMPKAAKELGAIEEEVSLSQMTREIFKALKA